MPKVMVVPEIGDGSDEINFTLDVLRDDKIWVNIKLGTPKLEENNAKYIAPYWLKKSEDKEGVIRIYHIIPDKVNLSLEDATEINLGNSFVLPNKWKNLGQHRRFEYHDLADFGMEEIEEGLLQPIKQ